MLHELKTVPPYYHDVASGKKTFEIRRADRNFQVGDELLLREWVNTHYTGHKMLVRVTYITSFAQQDGYVVMGIRPVSPAQETGRTG